MSSDHLRKTAFHPVASQLVAGAEMVNRAWGAPCVTAIFAGESSSEGGMEELDAEFALTGDFTF
ncbi:hypothetical protein [Amycolatopsis sp. NPDC049868]|uniref:hypothetical protein n=1 Tax=Amycolatopsis sp. NPDC049868 TaxID=3363934 RepID=UPI00379F7C90